jgi:hypothetical protein
MSARNLPLALILLALGFALGFVFSPRSREVPKDGDRSTLEAIDARLERLEQALGRERAGAVLQPAAPPTGMQEPTAGAPPISERFPVASERGPAIEESGQPSMAAELANLHAAMESLRQAVVDHSLPARFPTQEMIRGAPEPNTPALEDLLARAYGGSASHAAMKESVRWKSQEEVLALYGRPTSVGTNGNWFYDLTPPNAKNHRWVYFEFVENYVTGVTVTGP